MKIFYQMLGLTAMAVIAAALTFTIARPQAEAPCDPATVPSGYICLSSIQTEWADETIAWIDARPRKKWEKSRVEGAVLLNIDPAEDYEALLADSVEVIALSNRVVVYCGKSGCKASSEIAKRLREAGLSSEIYVLQGGEKALKGLLVIP